MTTTQQSRWRMPAEWQAHEATWIAWPHRRDDWPGKFAPIPWVYAEIVRQLSRCERVHILVNDDAAEKKARRFLLKADADLRQVQFFHFRTDRVWTRDYGPTFLIDGASDAVRLLDWQFNAWAKYPDWQLDTAVPAQIAAALGLTIRQPVCHGKQVVLEGGSIDVNGAGLLLTTEECLLSNVQERNPGMSRGDYEKVFAEYLGIDRVLWLDRGIAGDDTHGHIDDLARFVGPRTVATAVTSDPHDENYVPLRENLERLHGMRLDVVTLPMPAPLVFEKRRLPASYANFYIANDRVLVPTFNDANDRIALGVLAEVFPGRQIIGIHAVDLVWGLGTLHCLTQQQPAAKGSQ